MSRSRLSERDKTIIVRELERWREGELGSKLTWEILEKSYGYSRQTLQAHLRIKSAYQLAKRALRSSPQASKSSYKKEIDILSSEIVTLKAAVEDYKEREQEWQKRWQRIAYHIRAKGLNMNDIDRGITQVPDRRTATKILSDFDNPLPPSGRT